MVDGPKITDALSTLPWAHIQQWARVPGNAPLLLTGNDDATLTAAATTLATILLCEKYQWTATATLPCGTCRACRLVSSSNHPDLVSYQTDKATWSVKAVREIFKTTILTPNGNRRIIVVHQLEKVSLPAANALLKSLEEPRAATSLILTSRWPKRLLPTILSRCYTLSLATTIKEAAAPIKLDVLEGSDLDETALTGIAALLEQLLRRSGPTPALKRAYARLRDYHVISSRNGNKKLAGDVLLLSLPSDNGMS